MTVVRPTPGVPRQYTFPTVERTTLSNGLRIAVARMPRLPLVTVLALVDAGSSCDSAGCEGAAALTALALGEGTAKLSGGDLVEQFERLGTGFDSGIDWDDAVAQLTVTPERLGAAVKMLGEVLTAPAFRSADLERLKRERLAELLQLQAEPRGLANEKFSELLYAPRSRYAKPSAGDRQSVSAITVSEVGAFHRAHYTPSTTTLIFAGDVTVEQAVQLTERAFWGWSGPAVAPTLVNDDTAQHGRFGHIVHKADAPQSELRIGHRGVPRNHSDYFPIVVMNALLGGLFSSRINLNLRERNAFTYGASSGFDWRRGAGPFVVATAVKTEVTGPAIREILLEIDRMRQETVQPEELTLATDYLTGVFPIRYETTRAVAAAIATATVYGLGDDYYTVYRERVRAVTAADVQRAAQQHLHPESMLVVAVGDAPAIRESLAALDIGAIQVHSEGDAL
jgi:zinc protease